MASTSLEDLIPDVRVQFHAWVAACAARGVTAHPYCTYRSPEEQAAEYAKGRTVKPPWRTTTDAQPWQSWHQVRRAVDACPLVNGKCVWEVFPHPNDETRFHIFGDLKFLVPEWLVLVEEADKLGIEWAGRWTTFVEYVHFQVTGGLTIEQARVQLGV